MKFILRFVIASVSFSVLAAINQVIFSLSVGEAISLTTTGTAIYLYAEHLAA